jgi:hypothetical protein
MDQQRRVLEQPCHPTDGLSYTLYILAASVLGLAIKLSLLSLCLTATFAIWTRYSTKPTYVAALRMKNGPVH